MGGNGTVSMSGTFGRRGVRKWWAALAVVALTFLLLRPACDAWLSHSGGHEGSAHAAITAVQIGDVSTHAPHDVLCCASIKSSSVVQPADSALARSAQGKVQLAALVARAATTPVVASLRRSLGAFVIPPGIPSFYERSARILR
jgi:hypothetical protein